jgi:hypothetical protein
MAMRKPNFFLLGAAKCGTTSMSRYLAEHPQVFFSRPKEPHYFSTDYYEHNRIWTEDEYLRLFRRANENHLAIGEGSVWYIASKTAASKIMEFNATAKFIVMVRSPLEMVRAIYSQNVFDCIEDQPDVESAWRIQKARERGLYIPFLCCEPKELLYSDRCMLGAQLSCLMAIVPRERIKVIVMDDLRFDTRSVYEQVTSFLELPSDHRTEFPIYNENKIPRWPAWAKFLAYGGKLKKKWGLHTTFSRGDLLVNFNAQPSHRQPMRPEFQAELSKHFTPDVELLSRLLDRDLTGWLRTPQ